MEAKTLKRLLSRYDEFYALVRDGYTDTIPVSRDGEQVCFWDLLQGFDELTEKQKMAVFLHVMLDFDGKDTARLMGYTHERGADIVREYAMLGLKKMAATHNEGDDGRH